MKIAAVIFPHQLYKEHELYQNCDEIFLVEESLFFTQYSFHKQKLVFHRSSMKYHFDQLSESGIKVRYIEVSDEYNDIRVLLRQESSRFDRWLFIDPTDDWLEKRIRSTLSELRCEFSFLENPSFINTKEELGHFFRPDKKKFFQTAFYKGERTKRDILLTETGDPVGGKWSFDPENRKRFPADRTPPSVHWPSSDEYITEARAYAETKFPDNPGSLVVGLNYPYNPELAEQWFQQFLEFRFLHFGTYEDALQREEFLLHHSLLSPLMNAGLLHPQYVIDRAIGFAQEHKIPINDLEGFVRQILGWREFIRGMYEVRGAEQRTRNFWDFSHHMPEAFYEAETGIFPIDDAIRKVLHSGYSHHIERLMVLGNFMLLCEIDPNEVYRWFMELYIDAYDWVMVPNVYAMSQFADGGTMTTKPYLSGSNYLRKMGNYPKGEWEQIWDALFWRFMHKQRAFFETNPRLRMLLGNLDKMETNKRNALSDRAEGYLQRLHS